jgi:hypothetical protein
MGCAINWQAKTTGGKDTNGETAADAPGVIFQDNGTRKPKVEGWSTNPNDFSDEDCQGFADQIQGSIDQGIENLENNDIDGAVANMDSAESIESLAGEMGCVISYPEKATNPDSKGANFGDDKYVGVAAQDQGNDTDEDTNCEQSNFAANEIMDHAGDAFAENNIELGFDLIELAEGIEADANAEGCEIKYT